VLNSTAKEIRVMSSLNFSRDYIYLADVVSALVAIAEGASSAIYNLASGENLVNSDLFSLIYKITGVSIIGEIESPSNSSPSIDIQRITTTFNWLPQSPVEVIKHILEAGHKRKC
jgi:nucleoside-diphosphate-sugar epimerase